MQTTEFTTQIIKADEGHFLTQAAENTPITERVIADTVALGRNDSPENWKEITSDEAEEIRKEQNKESERQRKEMEKQLNLPSDDVAEETNDLKKQTENGDKS